VYNVHDSKLRSDLSGIRKSFEDKNKELIESKREIAKIR